MAKYYHTEGICLRRIHYSNTSQVASFLTPDAGRLSFMAKGVTRAPKKGIRTGFDLMGRYELVYTKRRSGSLQNLTYRWMREDFRGMRGALERILCGYYAAELALSFTAEGDPCPSLYELMVQSLRSLADGRHLRLTVLLLELGVLREHGSLPGFGVCAECGKAVPGRGAVVFSPSSGGPLCRRCEKDLKGKPGARTTTVKGEMLRTFAGLSSSRTPRAPTAQTVVAMSAVLRFHMRDLLGKELGMWRYLQQRQLSRSLGILRRRAGLS